MAKLDEIVKNINKKYGFDIVGKVEVKKRSFDTFPFRTPALTFLFRGGMPRTIIELLGLPSSGKSSLCYSICGSAQKVLQKEYEEEVNALQELTKPSKEEKERLAYLLDRGAKKVVYLDSEFSTDEEWATKNGVDVDDLLYIAPENQTAEQLFQIILDLISSDGVGLVVIDSIPALVSQQAMEKTMEEKTYAGISAPLSTFCSKVLPLCNKYKTSIIGVNQQRDDMAGFNRIISPGGKMWKHTAFIRMVLKKGKYYDSNYKELNAHPEEAYGNLVEVEVIKNKATKPDRHLCKFSITYDCGVDGLNDAFEMGVALNLIDKGGAWYSILDANGEPKEYNGTTLKFQGKKNFIAFMKENPDFAEELRKQVEEAVEKD